MSTQQRVVVAGLGEIGKPLFDLISTVHLAVGVDIKGPSEPIERCDVLHVCYPFQIPDFIGETARYIRMFNPGLTVIHSTVAVGTTRTIAERTGATVVNSPIRGKHARMLEDLKKYTKFIGAMDPEAGQRAAEHFQSVGLKTRVFPAPETSELAKLTETTYFGVLIGWAQEVERYCDALQVRYEDVIEIFHEINYLPPVDYFPGVIGGHCVMPNIDILSRMFDSNLLEALKASNRRKIARQAGLREVEANVPVGSAS